MLRWTWPRDARIAPTWHGRGRNLPSGFKTFDILQDSDTLADVVNEVDVVLSLAGSTPTSSGDLRDTVPLARAVLAATTGKTPLLIASSAAVYGRAPGLCREGDTVVPVNAYGTEKLAMERVCHAQGGPVTCLRIGNVAGADQILGRVTANATPLTLDRFDDGSTPARSYIGPGELARILADLCLAAGRGIALPPILNVTAPGAAEMGALLDAVPHPWTPRPAPKDAIREVLLDTTLLGRFTPLDPEAGSAERIVADWKSYQEAKT